MRRWLLAATGVAAAALLAAVLALSRLGDSMTPATRIGGPFTLTAADGRTVTDRDFRGRWMLVYFGYTHCPDACPTALNDIANALDLLGDRRGRVAPVFITVDPARDTVPVMRDYLSAFEAPITGLTGSEEAIAGVEREYRVYAARHPEKGGDYSMDHSSIIYVMDPQGRFVTNFTHETSPPEMARKLQQLGA